MSEGIPDVRELFGQEEHTLPASWLTSKEIFEVEKRAVFFKTWLYTTHASRFKKAGDYLSFQVAGLSFFVIKNKQGQLNAFHNVCRHRAYPIVKKEQGSSIILGCKYHGWSYNTDGKLTKAPQFDNVAGFDKSVNSLYSIHTHVTDQGLVFINFDSSDAGPVDFDEWFGENSAGFGKFDFSDYEHYTSFQKDGKFNWKTLVDGYQECYECTTAHPSLSKSFELGTNAGEKSMTCRSHANKQDGKWIYLFPSNGLNCYDSAWYSVRILPVSATQTILQYDVYQKKGINEKEIDEFVESIKQIEQEEFDLCETTQANLSSGVFSTGVLHPNQEKGVVYYQRVVKDLVLKHLAEEKAAGRKINPAFCASKSASEKMQALDKICQDLECGTQPDPILAW